MENSRFYQSKNGHSYFAFTTIESDVYQERIYFYGFNSCSVERNDCLVNEGFTVANYDCVPCSRETYFEAKEKALDAILGGFKFEDTNIIKVFNEVKI